MEVSFAVLLSKPLDPIRTIRFTCRLIFSSLQSFVLSFFPLQLFRSPKSDWKYNVSIQHISSKKYLRIEPTQKNKVALHIDLHPELSVFEVHGRRNSDLVGFMNKCTRTWLGQSTLGYIVCNVKKFGRNEEWDIDEIGDVGIGRSKLLCACANWGNGGWLKVDEQNESFAIGNYDSQEKKSASTWSIVIHDTGSHD